MKFRKEDLERIREFRYHKKGAGEFTIELDDGTKLKDLDRERCTDGSDVVSIPTSVQAASFFVTMFMTLTGCEFRLSTDADGRYNRWTRM